MADFPILSSIIPKTGIKVSFFDTDGKKVSGVNVDQANQVAEQNPDKKFYFQNGDGVEQELGIDAVNQLLPTDLLPTAPECPTAPQTCGPPLVKFFGGGGFGASANAIISPISSSVIAFDIANSGFGFLENVSAELMDPCGKGSGSKLRVNLEEDEEDTTGEDIITGGAAGAAGGAGGTPLTAGDTPVTAGGTSITAGGTGGTPLIVGGSPVTAGGTGGTPLISGGTGGTPLIVGGSPVTAGGTPITVGGTGGTPVTAGATPITVGGTGGTPVTAGGTATLDECSAPRKNFENKVRRNLNRSKKIKNITIIAPGNGYIPSPDGSLGGNERVWKEPDEGYVKSKCGGFYVVQPYRPIPVKTGDTYYPPDGPPILIVEDQIITLPLVPVTPPIPEIIGPSYPVILVIDEVVVLDPGFGYRPGDKIIITSADTGAGAGGTPLIVGGTGGTPVTAGGTPITVGGTPLTAGGTGSGNGKSNLGAELEMIINDRGQIEKVNVIKPGAGFIDLPRLRTNSPTGFNATFSTILKPIRLEDFDKDLLNRLNDSQIISVIDCVGKISPKPQFDIIQR